ncbi:MAG: UV DNA damage repair endonuclease UvsE [Alkalibacterium sp.]|nr:UV DNA damage repair endonuclease UvsE [Alkalibacterium sp.]
MTIGYACLTRGVMDLNYKTCRRQNATRENLTELIEHNLAVLEAMIDYNHQMNIRLFRMSSDIIPFGSDFNVNDLNWSALFKERFDQIGKKIQQYDMRVSMHPGQYTVLNSPNPDVVSRAIDDLTYHTQFIDNFNVGSQHKIILHIGGVYGDKEAAVIRFIDVYKMLDDAVKARLIIENDDRLYTIEDVLYISENTGAPVVYDNLHHYINGKELDGSDAYWISKAKGTWKDSDGNPKVHYSQQQLGAREGAHSQTVRLQEFLGYYESIAPLGIDIMLEVKDKNLSAVKCILATSKEATIKDLEKEWSRYKYAVLERSPSHYQKIRELLKDKASYPVVPFYRMIEEAMDTPLSSKVVINSLDHVWGYVKGQDVQKDKKAFEKYKKEVDVSVESLPKAKRFLKRMALKQQQVYLLESYYFDL